MDWAAWQALGQTVWDWGSRMSLGGLIGWFLRRWVEKRDKIADRGQQLVDAARPELVPINNLGGQHTVQLNVENHGNGAARTLRIGFTGVQETPTVDNVPFGQARVTASLNVQGSPLFNPVHHGQAEITLVYADRYANEYQLSIPVTRQARADGGFNMAIDFHGYRNVPSKLSKARLREVGGS